MRVRVCGPTRSTSTRCGRLRQIGRGAHGAHDQGAAHLVAYLGLVLPHGPCGFASAGRPDRPRRGAGGFVRSEEAPTALMIKERRTSSRTSVWYYRTGHAGSRLRADQIDLDAVRAASLLHVTGISLALSDTLADTVMQAV